MHPATCFLLGSVDQKSELMFSIESGGRFCVLPAYLNTHLRLREAKRLLHEAECSGISPGEHGRPGVGVAVGWVGGEGEGWGCRGQREVMA